MLGELGGRIFDEYEFSSVNHPDDLEWLITEMTQLARERPELTDMELLEVIMEGKKNGLPKPRYTIEDMRTYAEYQLKILERAIKNNPDINWHPSMGSAWRKLAGVTKLDMDLALTMAQKESSPSLV